MKIQVYKNITHYHMFTVSTAALVCALSPAAADPLTIPVNGVESESHVATPLENGVSVIALDIPTNIDVFVNNGTVSSSGSFSTDPAARPNAIATATAILGDVSLNSFTNNGEISASASTQNAFLGGPAGSSIAVANAVGENFIDGGTSFTITGDFTNTGAISASAATADNPTPDGSLFASAVTISNMGGNFTNASGSIISASISGAGDSLSTANSPSFNDGFVGVTVGNIGGNFRNDGTISTSADNGLNQSSSPLLVGTSVVLGDLGGNFTNTGAIATDVTYDGIDAVGAAVGSVLLLGDTTGVDVLNSGSVSTRVDFQNASGFAFANAVGGTNINSFTASETSEISVTALAGSNATTAGGNALAFAVSFDDIATDMNNSGTISATASGGNNNTGSANANADGLSILGDVGGNVTNTGAVTVDATSGSDNTGSANANANGLSILGDIGGSFSNTASIEAVARAGNNNGSSASARAEAIDFDDDTVLIGDYYNSGTLLASAFGGSDNEGDGLATVNGLDAGNILGDFTNDGAVTATAVGGNNNTGTGRARADGLDLDGDIGGDLVNTGALTVSATGGNENGDEGAAAGNGIILSGALDGDFTNAGDLLVTSFGGNLNGESGDASADGLDINGDIGGDFSNTASIEVIARSGNNNGSSASARAEAIDFDDDTVLIGDYYNSGTLLASAFGGSDNEGDGLATVNGLDAGNILGDFTNDGAVTATAVGGNNNTGTGRARADGLDLDGDIAGNLVNTGALTISATGGNNNGDDGSATGNAIVMTGSLGGDFTNSGVISVNVISGNGNSGEAIATAAGITFENDIVGTFANTANVTAIAKGGDNNSGNADVSATGINLQGTLSGSFSNAVNILAESTIGQSGANAAEAYGVRINNLNGGIENTGSVVAVSDEVATAFDIGNLDGLFVNRGSIVARSQTAGQDLAINLQAGSGQLDLHTVGFIDGQIHVNGHDVNVISAGPEGSAVFSIVDNAADQGVTPSTYLGVSLGQNWLIAGTGTEAVSALFYDPSSYAAAELETAALLNLISGGITAPDLEATRLTISGTTGSLENDGNRVSTLDNEADITSWALRAETPLMGSVAYITLGQVDTQRGVRDERWSRYSSHSDADGFYAGAGLHRSIGEFGLGLDIGYGELSHDQVRNSYSNVTSNNSVRNTARYDSHWRAANLSFGRAFALQPALTITPGVRFGVISHNYDGYTETGDFGVSAKSVDVGIFDSEFSVDLVKQFKKAGRLRLSAGYLNRESDGDSDVAVALSGVSNNIRFDNCSVDGMNFGVGYSVRMAKAFEFEVSGDVFDQGGYLDNQVRVALNFNF